MPPRTYSSPVSDDDILAVFAPHAQLKAHTVLRLVGLPRTRARIVAAQLRRLARPPHCRLVELAPPIIAVHRNPYYALTTSSLPAASASALTAEQLIFSSPSTDANIHDTTINTLNAGSVEVKEPLTAVLRVHHTDTSSTAPMSQDDSGREGAACDASPCLHVPARPPCCICHSTDATVVFLPCKHQLSCASCWVSAKKSQSSVHNRKERTRMELAETGTKRAPFQAQCLWCKQAVQDEIHPFVS